MSPQREKPTSMSKMRLLGEEEDAELARAWAHPWRHRGAPTGGAKGFTHPADKRSTAIRKERTLIHERKRGREFAHREKGRHYFSKGNCRGSKKKKNTFKEIPPRSAPAGEAKMDAEDERKPSDLRIQGRRENSRTLIRPREKSRSRMGRGRSRSLHRRKGRR